MTVHVAGNAGLDTTFALTHLPRPGETLNAHCVIRGLGSKGGNQAVAAARCAAAVALHAAIGTDAEASSIRTHLSRETLDLGGLVEMEGPSDASAILVDALGGNAIVTLAERARAFDPLASRAFADRLAQGDVHLMQGNLPIVVTLRTLAFARSRGATTIVNASQLNDADGWLFDDVDWLVVNAPEACVLSGSEDREAGLRRLIERGAPTPM